MPGIKRIDIKEFREKGFLQEANRLFFHPLGFALEAIVDEADSSESLGGVWDYREDAEGITYDPAFIDLPATKEKIAFVEAERQSHIDTRTKLYGGSIQQPNI